jgi:hypothetical protein
MAVTIPIISEYDGKGVKRAIEEFKQLETTGEKAQFALKKAAVPAAAALAGLAAGIGVATKAAIEDAAAQDQLAGVLERTTGATEAQVAANEKFITSLSMATAIADDELRPAMSTLANVTGDLQLSQELLAQATDISAATNTDLNTVVDALSKAYGGNLKGLQALDPSLRSAVKEGQSFSDIMQTLADKTGGAAARATETAAGKMEKLKITLAETKESIGAAFLPILEKLLPVLQKMATFVQNNTTAIAIIAGVIGAFAGAILAANTALKLYQGALLIARGAQIALNIAMAANPIGLIVVALGLLATAFVIAWQKSETFRDVIGKVVNFGIDGANKLVGAFENVANAVIGATNAVIRAINAVSPFADIPELSKISIGNIPKVNFVGGGGGSSSGAASGATTGGGGMRPIVPDRIDFAPSIGGGGGGGGGGGAGGGGATVGIGGGFSTGPLPAPLTSLFPDEMPGGRREGLMTIQPVVNNITVNTVTAPENLGETIVDALKYYNRSNGPIDVLVTA